MIEKDLAYVFKIGLDDALVLKEKFALAHKKNAIQNEIFNLEYANQEELVIINQLEASEVVMSRIEEMLSIAKRDINIMTNNSFDYVIITGGGSNMKSLSDLSLEIFGNCAIIGEVKLIGIRNNKFASAVGNIVYFITKLRLRDEEYSSFTEEDLEAISLIKKDKVTNDTMLGKVFGYFFNNEEDK